MSNALSSLSTPQNYKPKTFWQKPEGKPGMLLAAGAVAGGLYLLYTVGPFILKAIQTGIGIAITGAIFFAICDLLFGITGPGKTLRNVAINIFKSLARAAAWTYTTLDPIGILKNTLDDVKKELQVLYETVQKFTGSDERLRRKIADRENEIKTLGLKAQQAEKMAAQASTQLDRDRFLLQAQTFYEKAGLLMQGVKQLKELHTTTSDMLVKFQQLTQVAEAKVERTEAKVEFLSDQRKMILDAKGVLASGMRLLRGNPEQVQQVDMALEYLADDTAQTLGAIREFTRNTDKLLTADQIEAGAAAEAAKQLFNDMNQKLITAVEANKVDNMKVVSPTRHLTTVYSDPRNNRSTNNDLDDLFN